MCFLYNNWRLKVYYLKTLYLELRCFLPYIVILNLPTTLPFGYLKKETVSTHTLITENLKKGYNYKYHKTLNTFSFCHTFWSWTYYHITEAATETVFQSICSFFPGATFSQFSRFVKQTCFFPGGSICSSNRPYYLIEKILIFPETLIIFSPRTHTNFPRASYFLIEQISIFQELLFSHRTDINLPVSSI